jgi:hypothetical protein
MLILLSQFLFNESSKTLGLRLSLLRTHRSSIVCLAPDHSGLPSPSQFPPSHPRPVTNHAEYKTPVVWFSVFRCGKKFQQKSGRRPRQLRGGEMRQNVNFLYGGGEKFTNQGALESIPYFR